MYGYKLNGTEVIDTSRNLVNIGTINTGQGATEVHLMNQNVRTTDNVTFNNLTVNGTLNGIDAGDVGATPLDHIRSMGTQAFTGTANTAGLISEMESDGAFD